MALACTTEYRIPKYVLHYSQSGKNLKLCSIAELFWRMEVEKVKKAYILVLICSTNQLDSGFYLNFHCLWDGQILIVCTLQQTMAHQECSTHGIWTFNKTEHHILKSNGEDRERFENELKPLPEIPEMTFDKNVLRIEHDDGYGIEFNALDALKLVNPTQDVMKVSCAEDWKSTRVNQENIQNVAKPFDWTYTTHYKGTLLSRGEKVLTIKPTEERIDYQKLKQEEKILFFASFLLFEDELADNGASILSLKFRSMASGYFILLRFYLRVDNVMVRIYDTRIHCDYSKPHLLREFSVRECPFNQISHVPPNIICDPMQAAEYIPLVSKVTEKLTPPS